MRKTCWPKVFPAELRAGTALALLALAACGCSPDNPGPGGEANTAPVQTAENISLYSMKNGNRDWAVKASEAVIFESEKKIEFKNPVIDIYQNGAVSSVIKAKAGVFHIGDKLITLKNSVSAESFTEKCVLYTSLLNYSSLKKLIWTHEKVRLEQEGMQVKGKGFEAKPDLSEIKVRHQETSLPPKMPE